MMESTLEVHITLRMGKHIAEQIEEKVKADPERYDSLSHFIRVAIMRHLKEGK